METNKYVENFIENTLCGFRKLNQDPIEIQIRGIYCPNGTKERLDYLATHISSYDIHLYFEVDNSKTQIIETKYKVENQNDEYKSFIFEIQGIVSLIQLSSKTDLTITELIVIQIVGQVINRIKPIFKAIVLDLDDTLWPGTLSEIGKEEIKSNLNSLDGKKFCSFMKLVKRIGDELGIYIAICSRNNINQVQETFDSLTDEEFPLKGQIDTIAINNNDKSGNIVKIAKELSILTNAIVFIDDNPIIRDEVKKALPEVYVPNWSSHEELILLLETSYAFERPFFSNRARERRKQYRIIKAQRERNHLPTMICEKCDDDNHIESCELYGKSNQFNFSQRNQGFDTNHKSYCFKIFTPDNDNLGVCSTITFEETENKLIVHNWAISCRFFEIGLEECILKFLHNLSQNREVIVHYNDSGKNERVKMLLNEYPEIFVINEGHVSLKIPSQDYLENMTNITIR